MATVDFSLDVVCDSCGSSLDVSQTDRELRVYPCGKCLKSERDDGREEGYADGLKEGESNATV
jgi:hypothetical protein